MFAVLRARSYPLTLPKHELSIVLAKLARKGYRGVLPPHYDRLADSERPFNSQHRGIRTNEWVSR